MKKTILSLAMLALCGSVLAGPLEDKLNAYNALRANKPNTPVLDVRALLRNEAGVTSSNPGQSGNSCAICGLGTTAIERPGAGGALPAYNPTNSSPNTGMGSVLDSIPAGLGVPPAAIVRTAEGTGAAWQNPNANEDYRYASYESQYAYYQQQYDAQVTNIINAYMDPNNGKLARARVALLDTVERQVNEWMAANPGASVADRARMESAFIQANGPVSITSLVGRYQAELAAARAAFDQNMYMARAYAENPPDQGGGA